IPPWDTGRGGGERQTIASALELPGGAKNVFLIRSFKPTRRSPYGKTKTLTATQRGGRRSGRGRNLRRISLQPPGQRRPGKNLDQTLFGRGASPGPPRGRGHSKRHRDGLGESAPPRLIDNIPHGLPVDEAAQIVEERLQVPLRHARRRRGAVRRDDHVRHLPERMVGGQRLEFKDI